MILLKNMMDTFDLLNTKKVKLLNKNNNLMKLEH